MAEELPQAPPNCPRCGVSIEGAYKFCPECAFRLRQVKRPAPETIQKPFLPNFLVLLGLIGFVTVFTLAGLLVFTDPGQATPKYERPRDRFMVAEIPNEIVWLEEGPAYYLADVPEEVPDEDPPPDGEEDSPAEDLVDLPVLVARFGMMRYEVTRGQYAEFLSAMAVSETEQVLYFHSAARQVVVPATDAQRTWGQLYLDEWWDEVDDFHIERAAAALTDAQLAAGVEPRPLVRPKELRVPLAPKDLVTVLAPPEWIVVSEGGLAWRMPEGTENLPVTGVSIYEAGAFAAWLGQKLQLEFRLPLHAEWRRAFHGGENTENTTARERGESEESEELRWRPYPWGWYADSMGCNSSSLYLRSGEPPRLMPVNRTYSFWHKGMTPDGLHSMSGNAREWVLAEDERKIRIERIDDDGELRAYFAPIQSERPRVLPTVGGSYLDSIEDCSLTRVQEELTYARRHDLGFRLAVNAAPR